MTSAMASAGAAPTSGPTDSGTSSAAIPVTEEQAEMLGREIARTLSAGDATFFSRCTDNAAMSGAGYAGLAGLPDWMQNRKEPDTDLSFQWLGLQCKLLRVGNDDGRPVPILRISKCGGIGFDNYNRVDYFELQLASRPDGTVRVVDVYKMSSGELTSETIHRGALETVASNPRLIGYARQLGGKDKDYVLHYSEIRALYTYAITCSDEGTAAYAESTYGKLPETLSGHRIIMLLHVFTSTGLGRAPFKKALLDFRRVYPDDIGEATRIINSFVILSQYDEALAEIDRLDAHIGGDPMLDVERGYVAYHAEKPDEEKKFYRRAVEREPTLRPAWYGLVWRSLDEKQYDQTVALLNESGRRAGLRWDRVSTSFLFAAFWKTPQYADWVKTHPQSSAPETQSNAGNWPNWGN